MTRVEFVRQRFMDNVQNAIDGIKDNKGSYKQYIDAWDHDIEMTFEVVGISS